MVGMEVDEGSEVGATEREEYYEDLEDEHSAVMRRGRTIDS